MSDEKLLSGKQDKQDEQLARMFADMRAQDALEAPAYPAHQAAVDREPANEERLRRANTLAPVQWAGAIAALLLVAIVALPRSESPEDIYMEIMSANSMITEDLAMASPGTLPEQYVYPDVFGEAEPVDFAEFLN